MCGVFWTPKAAVCRSRLFLWRSSPWRPSAADLEESFLQANDAVKVSSTSGSLQECEAQAKRLLQKQDFSFQACEQLLMQTNLRGPREGRECVRGSSPGAGSYVFGMFQHGGVWGITNRSRQRPHLTKYVNGFLDMHGADRRRESFAINFNVRSKIHVDCHNEDGAYNSVITLGAHRGGEMWMDARCQPLGGRVLRREVRELESGELLDGHVVGVRERMASFDDVFYVNFGLYRVPILNMVDSGTGYHITQQLPIVEEGQGGTPTSDATWRAFLATWVRFLGPPGVLVCDSGSNSKLLLSVDVKVRESCNMLSSQRIHGVMPWPRGMVDF